MSNAKRAVLTVNSSGPIPEKVYVLGCASAEGWLPVSFADDDGEAFVAAFPTMRQLRKAIRVVGETLPPEGAPDLAGTELAWREARNLTFHLGVDYLALSPFQGRDYRTFYPSEA